MCFVCLLLRCFVVWRFLLRFRWLFVFAGSFSFVACIVCLIICCGFVR